MKYLILATLTLGSISCKTNLKNSTNSLDSSKEKEDSERPNNHEQCTISIDETISVDVEYAYAIDGDDGSIYPDYISCKFYDGDKLKGDINGMGECSLELKDKVVGFDLTSGSLEMYFADFQDNRTQQQFECE